MKTKFLKTTHKISERTNKVLSLSLNRKRCLNTKRFLFIDGAGLIVGERFLSESFQCASDNLLKILEIRENVIVFERANSRQQDHLLKMKYGTYYKSIPVYSS